MDNYFREMPPVAQVVVEQADKIRDVGNGYYKKCRFGAAIEAYTEAIALNPDARSYTNRAQCFRKKKNWARVEDDSRKAIQLDASSLKGHYLLGLALVEKKEYADGIKELEKAIDLGRALYPENPESYKKEEIWQILAKAKYAVWEEDSNMRTWKLRELKEECEQALKERYRLRYDDVQDEAAAQKLEHLSEAFNKLETQEKEAEIPDYLCCRISLELFRDPVITPSGITYERSLLFDHIRKVGHFDPTTREPLEMNQLIPNLAIKDAVTAFLDENGWAYKTMEVPTVILE